MPAFPWALKGPWRDPVEAVSSWFASPAGTASHDDALGTVPRPAITPGQVKDIIISNQRNIGILALAVFFVVALPVGARTVRVLSWPSSKRPPSRRRPRPPDGPISPPIRRAVRVLTHGPSQPLHRIYEFMMSFAGMFGSFGRSGPNHDKQQDELLQKNREKLKSYHELAQEAIQRAYTADQQGRYDIAVRLYGTGLEAAKEGLALLVGPGNGLGPKADSVTGWRGDLQDWAERVGARMQALSRGDTASTSAPPVRPLPCTAVTLASPSAPRPARGPSPQRPGSILDGAAAKRPISAGRARPPPAPAAPGSKSAVVQRQTRPAAAAAAAAAPRDDGLQKYREIVAGEILDRSPGVKWDDIAGLVTAKKALTEAVILPALRPDLFQGLRAPVRGILLYGPPGNGKTMLAKALAAQSKATFFNISASSLTSKWVGDGEKLVRALFELAAERQPSIIFMDELDSLLSARGKAGESDAARRLLTEFLVQFDGVGGTGRERVVVVGATNRPQELDDAVRRRLTKRIYIPLPDETGRLAVLLHLLKGQHLGLSDRDMRYLAAATDGYSASDLAALCKEAAMAPLRELAPERLASVPASALRPISRADFEAAKRVVRPSVGQASLQAYEDFTKTYGTQ